MRSLQWRMLAALGVVIALAWGTSIAMFLSYLESGPTTAWGVQLHSLGDRLFQTLPEGWVKNSGRPSSVPQTNGAAAPTVIADATKRQHAEQASILTAMLLNTVELSLVGVLMWWAVIASLKPLRATSESITRRKPFDSQPLSVDRVPTEIRPLILAFNSLLARVDTAMQAERQFIADAAHELRTPLAALQVQAEVAMRADTLDRKDDALRKVLDVSYRTHRLAEQLLDLARLDAGLHSTGVHYADLLQLARHVTSEFSVLAGGRGVRLVLTGGPALAKCDIDEIGILIRNLVDNAIRHGRECGTVDVHCGHVDRSGERRPILQVSDDGPGVPIEEQKAIFSRFYRSSGATATGSGIGLSLVAGIAELHNATIETGESKAGQGFFVRIVYPSPQINS